MLEHQSSGKSLGVIEHPLGGDFCARYKKFLNLLVFILYGVRELRICGFRVFNL